MGIVLYAMVVGETPFKAPNFAALRKKILKGSIHFPEYLSQSVVELISQLLQHDPAFRITMEGIAAHSWMQEDTSVQLDLLHPLCHTNSTVELDMHMVDKLQHFGFTSEFIVESVTNNHHNHATTCYHLLCAS